MRQRREKETRLKESGWERPSVAMETGSYQLTPCFPLVPHPPPNSLPFPSLPLPARSSFHHLTPTSSSSFIFFLSVITTPLSPFSPTPPPLPPASRALYINHTLVSSHLTLSSLPPPLLSPLASLLFTVAQIKPTTLLNPQKKRLRG